MQPIITIRVALENTIHDFSEEYDPTMPIEYYIQKYEMEAQSLNPGRLLGVEYVVVISDKGRFPLYKLNRLRILKERFGGLIAGLNHDQHYLPNTLVSRLINESLYLTERDPFCFEYDPSKNKITYSTRVATIEYLHHDELAKRIVTIKWNI